MLLSQFGICFHARIQLISIMKVQKFDTKIFMAILHLLFSQLTFLNSPHNLMNLSVPSFRFVTLSGAENFAIIMFIMHAI